MGSSNRVCPRCESYPELCYCNEDLEEDDSDYYEDEWCSDCDCLIADCDCGGWDDHDCGEDTDDWN